MRCTVFPKFFQSLGVEQLAETLCRIGFDGVDVIIREAYWVQPEDMHKTLPQFVRVMQAAGLSTESATADVGGVRDAAFERRIGLLAECGFRSYRYQGFAYTGRVGTFHRLWQEALEDLRQLERINRKLGIRALLQMHGGNLHASPSASYWLVRDFDPAAIGLHLDPGNMIHQEGWEEYEKAVDIVQSHLAYVVAKNAGWYYAIDPQTHQHRWQRRWTPLAEGIIDWPRVIRALRAVGYDGPICMHNFYPGSLDVLEARTREDLAYLRDILAA